MGEVEEQDDVGVVVELGLRKPRDSNAGAHPGIMRGGQGRRAGKWHEVVTFINGN